MWMWPLDNAMGATFAHRAPERMADGTCTRGWTWMTDKCRRRMNIRKGYITREISQREERGGGGGAALRTPESYSREVSKNWEGEELILGRSPRIDLYPSTMPLMNPLPNDPVRPLTKSLLRPSSWARFFTKFIVLNLLSLSSLTSTVEDPSN